jgi:parallel beta-helix repeat protein
MKRIVCGCVAALLLALTLGRVAASGQGLIIRPAPIDAANLPAITKLMGFFTTLPFAPGEVDLSELGVSDAELASAGPQAPSGPTGGDHLLIVDNDLLNCPNADYTRIQDAVDAAQPGAKIKVCPGTYVEQVVVPTGKDGLTLFSEGAWQAVIKAPPVMTEPKAIVLISGAQNVTLTHFTIRGPGGGPCDSLRWGVRVDNGGSALITHNRITDIRDTPLSGCQNGVGVLVGRDADDTVGFATVVHNLIERYQKGGIVIDGVGGGVCCPDDAPDFTDDAPDFPDFADFTAMAAQAATPTVSTAEVAYNIVVGIGPSVVIAQNGIQVSRQANADVHHNRVSHNNYALPVTVSEGILLFEAGAATNVHHNYLFLNDDGVGLFGTADTDIAYNRAEQNDFDGIYAASDTAGNLITHNKAQDNAEHDCHDDTPAFPSLNEWIKNLGETENKPGLCKSTGNQ